jgi:hypothetical protein
VPDWLRSAGTKLAESSLTFPHDYRALFVGADAPTVVGGQAVNLWAIVYLDRDVRNRAVHGSHDMDIVSGAKALAFLKTLPGWKFSPTPMKHFGVGITAKLQSVAPDGRLLLVEILHSVAGLEAGDLRRVSEVEVGGVKYRLLDPIAMLKAKAYNARKFKQDGNPPRHDREHLELIARCVPEFLRELHDGALRLQRADDAAAKDASENTADAVRAVFATLADDKTAATLRAQGIPPESLIPPEFKDSPILKIANTWKHQWPRVVNAGLSDATKKKR